MNEIFTQFHFLRPAWLLALLPMLAIVLLLLKQQARVVNWQSIISPHLLPYLVDGKSIKSTRAPLYILAFIWALATVAIAGPSWKKLPQPVTKDSSALVIVWDLSPSMNAQDIKPSRLVRARLKLIDLLKQRKEGQTALVAYSGEAHVVTPLTDDTDTIISLLHGLDPALMPAKGSNIEMAVEMANQLLKEGSTGLGNILVLTDGIDESAHQNLAQLHDSAPHNITLWGIGSSEGAPIPLASGGFAYDANRNMVIAKLNDAELSELAVKLGGLYVPFSSTDFDLNTIKRFSFGEGAKQVDTQPDRTFDQWYEHGPYLLLLVLPFAALAFRRGLLLSFAVVFVLSPDTQALQWQDLWLNKNQRGEQLLQTDPAAAAQTFNDKKWQGIAQYQAGDYQSALEAFAGDTIEDRYNRANALTRLGEYKTAIELYENVLQQQPDLEPVKNNLEIAKQLLAAQQQQQNTENPQENSDDQQQSSDSSQSENSETSQQQNQQTSQQDSQSTSSQQQNSDQTSQANTSDENGDRTEQSGEQEGQQQTLSEDERQALQETYGEQENNAQQQASSDQADESETAQEMAQQESTQQRVERQDPMQTEDGNEPANPLVQQQMTDEQLQAEQTLEQWLRKVPDDPSGLMRNKFNYEYRERKRELRSDGYRQPDGSNSEQRW